MMWDEDDVRLVPLEWLKPHERIKERNRNKLLDMTKRWNGYTKPLIVDKVTGAILDGHHRFAVALILELKRIPVICVDYMADEKITVDIWQGSEKETLSKQEVIEMSLSGDLFPPKTSRHTISEHLPPIFIPLQELMLEGNYQP
ncbi:MAG: ParB N-terminal domain-containing protein [Candidatus Poseidoniaceae archaeon]|nr:ParB N-terminal domain-containing protein [Candidatus Poseidoniaceae archaeon]